MPEMLVSLGTVTSQRYSAQVQADLYSLFTIHTVMVIFFFMSYDNLKSCSRQCLIYVCVCVKIMVGRYPIAYSR